MKYFIAVVMALLHTVVHAQDFKAFYKVEQSVITASGTEAGGVIAKLDFEGVFLNKGNQYLFYKKPLYLHKYPDGIVEISNNENFVLRRHSVSTDTIQGIHYTDADSFILRMRWDMAGRPEDRSFDNPVLERRYEPGYQVWEILPDVKEISGLSCQKANWRGDNNEIIGSAWFAADVPITHGPAGIQGLPGLVVEATIIPWNETYVLQSFDMNVQLSPQDFALAELAPPYKKLAPIRRQQPAKK